MAKNATVRFLFLASMLVLSLGICPLHAGNPLQTNDPETPGRNGFEVNISDNLRFTRNLFTQHLPLLNINYGHVENDQWKISIPVLQVDPEPGAGHWGLGDIQLGWKYRFLEEDEHGFMASIYPQPLLPTGQSELGLGNGRLELFLPVSVGKHFWDDQLFVYAEAAHNVVFEDVGQDTWFFGVAAEWQITDKLELVGEIAISLFRGPGNPMNPSSTSASIISSPSMSHYRPHSVAALVTTTVACRISPATLGYTSPGAVAMKGRTRATVGIRGSRPSCRDSFAAK